MGNAFLYGTGGSGGAGGILTVTAPAGVIVSVSKDGKTKRKISNAEGLVVFKGLASGTWMLTITDGSQTSTKPVKITADYSMVIAFFSATINITYPAGSICTCTDGSTTLAAPDTGGTWVCVVPNAGTWTVSCTDGTESASEAVTITADGQSVSVALSYWLILFDNGQTVPWIKGVPTSGYSTVEIAETIVFNYSNVNGAWHCAGTEGSYDLSVYDTLYFDMEIDGHYDFYGGTAVVGVTSGQAKAESSSEIGGTNTFIAQTLPTVDGTRRFVSVDISAVDTGYITIYGIMKATIYKVWAE